MRIDTIPILQIYIILVSKGDWYCTSHGQHICNFLPIANQLTTNLSNFCCFTRGSKSFCRLLGMVAQQFFSTLHFSAINLLEKGSGFSTTFLGRQRDTSINYISIFMCFILFCIKDIKKCWKAFLHCVIFFIQFKANLFSNYSAKPNSYKTMQVICTEPIQMIKNPENSFSQSIFTQGFRFPVMQLTYSSSL